MRGRGRRAAAGAALLALCGATAAGAHAQAVAPKEIAAVRLSEPVSVDGVLDEAVWQAPGRTEFRRRSPYGGQPSENTEVWVAYDARALYVAVRNHDREPRSINHTIGPRDSEVESDWFTVSIDAYHDGRTGFFFGVGPGGSIQDGTLYDDARSDRSWDGVWQRAAATDSLGWTAELRIPFSQLRFTAAPEQTWGINFTRRIHRTNEVVDFTPDPRGRRGNVSLFASLVGLRDLEPSSRLEVLPYVVAQAHVYEGQPGNPFYTGRDFLADVGADLKVGIGSGLTLDATVNPDFGHVEVDPAVINLTATETFYAEKRPFFLEGASIYDFGGASGLRFFHSRRIGRVPQGTTRREGYVHTPDETGILGAAKLSGKVGESWTMGWMNSLTAREFAQVDSAGTRFADEVEPLTYYGVARAQRQFDGGSRGLGLFSTATVRGLGEERLRGILNGQALVGGIDGWSYFGARRSTAVEGWAGVSHVRGSPEQMVRQQHSYRRYFQRPDAAHLAVDSSATSLSGFASQLRLRHHARRLSGEVAMLAISPGFELNDLGYSNRADAVELDASLRYQLSGTDDGLDRAALGISVSREYDFGRTLLATGYTAFGHWQTRNFWGGSASLTFAPEGLDVRSTRGGPAMLRQAGWSGSVSMYSDSRSPVTLSGSADGGVDAVGSWNASAGGTLSWLASPRLALSVGPWWGMYFADAGYFTRRLDPTAIDTYGMRSVFAPLTQEYLSVDVRLDQTFAPGLSLQLYAQPYFTDIDYGGFKELARPGSYAFLEYGRDGSTLVHEDGTYTIDPDGPGPARAFELYESAFRYASLRGTAVLRWEYRAGSSLIVAWTHDRYAYEDHWEDWRGNLLESYPDNRIMLKLTYWLNPR